MIKAKKGNVKIKGTMHELLNDFGAVTHALYNAMPSEDFSKQEIKKEVLRSVFEFAMMTDEQQQAELKKKAKQSLGFLGDLLKKIVEDNDDSEEKSEESEEKGDAECQR